MNKIERTIYECEMCGNSSSNAGVIEECEKHHIPFDEETTLDPVYRSGRTYPASIKVTFSDGKEIEYCEKGTPTVTYNPYNPNVVGL